jgi:hypothetical protein
MGIQMVERWVGFKHAFMCVKLDALDNAIRFRSAYCDILLNVFVDCYPQKNLTKLNFAWVRFCNVLYWNILANEQNYNAI